MNAFQILFFIVVSVVALALVLFLANMILGLLGFLGALTFGLLPLVLAIAGLVSCWKSTQPSNTKILWSIIIVLAPILGPLLWFFWGKKNT
ncbi:MAG: PLDc_N domain-containing protein [Verrucomicrobia bacterium]|nr:PLDc_N domain-containing protein [Verrucomicrobiota bacterium]